MPLLVEFFIGRRDKRHQAHAARGIVAGALEPAELLDDCGLARLRRGPIQRMHMIENAHQHLQPIRFHPAELIHLQA